MNISAVLSDTRAVCRMLRATMITVYCAFNSLSNCSMRLVELGSGTEVGSSSNKTWGRNAIIVGRGQMVLNTIGQGRECQNPPE